MITKIPTPHSSINTSRPLERDTDLIELAVAAIRHVSAEYINAPQSVATAGELTASQRFSVSENSCPWLFDLALENQTRAILGFRGLPEHCVTSSRVVQASPPPIPRVN